MWDLQWGSRLDFLNDIAAGATTEDEIPQCLRERPVLSQFQRPYYDMFMDLTSSRQYTSAGIAEIPYPAKVLWLNENEIEDQDERRTFLQMVSAMDGAYLKHFHEKSG